MSLRFANWIKRSPYDCIIGKMGLGLLHTRETDQTRDAQKSERISLKVRIITYSNYDTRSLYLFRVCCSDAAGRGDSVGCASDWWSEGCGFDPAGSATFFHGIWSWNIFHGHSLLPLIQEGHLSSSGERICTILINRLEDYACPVEVWLGKLNALDITPLGWLGLETSIQTIQRRIRNRHMTFINTIFSTG